MRPVRYAMSSFLFYISVFYKLKFDLHVNYGLWMNIFIKAVENKLQMVGYDSLVLLLHLPNYVQL
jgi:hypothetical protein